LHLWVCACWGFLRFAFLKLEDLENTPILPPSTCRSSRKGCLAPYSWPGRGLGKGLRSKLKVSYAEPRFAGSAG
jgi:hypothetical protein